MSFGKMNRFIEITQKQVVTDSEGFQSETNVVVAKERVDGKLILPEAVQILKMKAGSAS